MAEEIRWSVVNLGKVQGAQVTRVGARGERHCRYEYELRGKPTRLEARIELDAGGLPVAIESTGRDFHGAEIWERFSRAQGKASWSNPAEQGDQELTGEAFYLSLNRVPEEEWLLARALLAAPAGRLPLLPAGEARIEKIGELEVEAGSASRKVLLYHTHGIELGPVPIWLDDASGFFALSYGWLVVILEGWEAAIPSLLEAERQAQTAHFSAVAVELPRRPAGALAFTGVRLFDSERGESVEGVTVVVAGNRISAVGLDGVVEIPAGCSVVDARGKSLLPGLWDMHAHLRENDGPLHLAGGVTSARDMGNDIERITDLRRRFDEGAAIGPRLVMAGWMDGVDPRAAPIQVRVDSEEEARGAWRATPSSGSSTSSSTPRSSRSWCRSCAARRSGTACGSAGTCPRS